MSAAEGTQRPFDASPFGAIAAKITGAQLDRRTRALLGRGDSARSGQPVWRNSYEVGQVEDRVWKRIGDGHPRSGRRWTASLLKAAKAYELRTRADRRENDPGARNGALGEVGIAVLEYLYERVDYMTGRLDPAIRTIADAIGRAYSAVHEALVRLRNAGFLAWMRRSEKIAEPEPGGPQVKQASNAYALLVPEAAKPWLGWLLHGKRTPACEEDHRRREKAEFDRMVQGLTAVEHVRDFVTDALLGPTLKRLAALVDAREEQKGESGRADETGGSPLYKRRSEE